MVQPVIRDPAIAAPLQSPVFYLGGTEKNAVGGGGRFSQLTTFQVSKFQKFPDRSYKVVAVVELGYFKCSFSCTMNGLGRRGKKLNGLCAYTSVHVFVG